MDGSFIASKIFVIDGAAEEVGDCFLAAMGVVGEACARGNGEVVLEDCVSCLAASCWGYVTYEHEEGCEVLQLSCTH